MVDNKWTLLVHGGAGIILRGALSAEQDEGARAGLTKALEAGSTLLANGGSAMDAVAAAVIKLEDDVHFNAGRGAVFTYEGINELDASIMEGATRRAGAVAAVRHTRNPVLLARAVMEHSPHVMLSRDGADAFSREQGLEQVEPNYFATPERWRQLEELKANKLDYYDIDMKYGTVGAVAVDQHGNVAAATSTGGLTGKRWGRIGDSPIIGAGNYADNRACAVSATGAGEFFIRLGVAHEICARMRMLGEDAKLAADHVITELGQLGGTGGVIVTAPDGTSIFSFNTPGMYRGRATSDGEKYVAIYGDE
ncbi:isoaspartyl peptidase/L-asparaginase family protein [Sphingorhabdus sp.]|jgi:beta-aspartyl-peptidase (threonine type)|uniref:isoaspartyl peptidase/L-asparaginase family protein n=1 Tax=Sphingorhabdus sp. TaxID=1902408 RepID=UPI0037C8FA8A